MKLKTGTLAPDFTLPDQKGKAHTLSDYRGKWVLIYFYPKDDTPGCTKEACGLRDNKLKYSRQKAVILGISPDSSKSHAKFSAKYDLPFTLLADEEKKVVRQYAVWGKKKFMGREYDGVFRKSFLVDPKGKLAKIYDKVKPEEHAEEVLGDIKEFRKGEK